MFELVRNARMFWLGVLEEAGLLPSDGTQREMLAAGSRIVEDTDRLTSAVRAMVANADAHARLHQEIAFFAQHSNDVLGRWAGVMLNSELYAEIIDRHVELAGIIVWISDLLDTKYPPEQDLKPTMVSPQQPRGARRSRVRARSRPGLPTES